MRHLKSGKKLNRTASHRKATLQSLASNLIEHKRIKTTTAKAKALRPYAEKLISKAKHALENEQNGSLPEGQSIDIHTRRIVARELKRKDVLQELFDSIAPVVSEREGGYTRIIKLGARRGDSAEVALIELVDWSNQQDNSTEKPKKKKTEKAAPAETVTEEKVEKTAKKEETTETAESNEVEETEAVATEEVTEEKTEVSEQTENVETTEEEIKEETSEVAEESETEESKEEDDKKEESKG